MRYVAIDLGDRRTGVAVGDSETGIASPLDVVEISIDIQGGGALLEALARAVEEQLGKNGPGELVLGLPLNMDGSEGSQSKRVRAFAARLQERTGRAVHFQDERLTTADADWAMAGTGMTRGQKKSRRDAIAAAAILRDFLGTERGPDLREGPRVPPEPE
jgi:putative holliday junction resolvase